MGDRKMKVVITQGVGPGVGRFGKEGRPKPRRVMVNEVGGRVEGFVEVGKVDGCVGLDVTVTGRSLCTLYYNGQPSLLDGRRLIKHRITLFPSSDTPPVTNDKGRGKATEPVIPHYTTYSFGFDFPRYCELEESREGPVEDDDDDYPVEKHATEPSSFGTRAIEISHSMGAGRRPSLGPHPAGSFGKEEEPAGPSSAGLSPSSWKNRMESRSPPTTGFGFGNFLKRNSFSAHSTSTSHHSDIGTPDEATGKRGFLRRLSTSQSVSRPPLELQYDLPPSTNLMLGDVQAEIEYQIKIRLRRKGLRFNDSLPLKTMWTIDTIDEVQPAPSPQRDHVVDSPRAIQARSPPSRQIAMPQAQADRPSLAISPSNHHSPGDISNTGPDQAWQAPPSSFETIEEENLATPPPEFAETYTGPSNLLAPFPPENSDNPAEENVYVTGKISLCRSSFRSILAPLNTPEIVVEYFLDVAITPKSGSVKESFTPLKQRWPVMYERL
ncbi:hypothetical protein QFC19_001259 [Naganishia cerealis]|uniref:Uncharacterized protein n=1 Tax=Naganishia cerealis TaxID=610337 RepID=A0ACC2WIZ9_9TREE|nr:hypothetical protein QFC19_001259 [Naganishia cerealis]